MNRNLLPKDSVEWGMLVLIILFLAIMMAVVGCKKCADCTTTVTTKVTGQAPMVGTSVTEMCGDELKEADGYQTTATSTVNGYTATITTKCDCK